jgi:hypothetical protein
VVPEYCLRTIAAQACSPAYGTSIPTFIGLKVIKSNDGGWSEVAIHSFDEAAIDCNKDHSHCHFADKNRAIRERFFKHHGKTLANKVQGREGRETGHMDSRDKDFGECYNCTSRAAISFLLSSL